MADGGVKGGVKRKVDLCGRGCMPLMPILAQGFSIQNSNSNFMSGLEFPYEVIIRKIYVTALEAPGGTDTYTVTVGDGVNNETVTLTGAEVKGSNTSGTAHVAKNTGISINVATSATGADNKAICVEVVFQPCEAFYDAG